MILSSIQAVDFFIRLFNTILENKRMSEGLKRSVQVPIFKYMADVQRCINYRGRMLMRMLMREKLQETVAEAG